MQKKDLLTNLPQEMMIEILGRLPISSIITCTHVCKSWRNLIKGGDFATLYTPKPGFGFVHRAMGYAVCDEDYKPLCQFGLPPPHKQDSTTACDRAVVGSVDGLLLVRDGWKILNEILFVCNPIISEYIDLPRPPTRCCVFGFGVSKLSGQYKILCGDYCASCYVYTLGRGGGSWRSIGAAIGRPRLPRENAVFLNGNLHWLTSDPERNPLICCFDLETELFTSYSLPPRYYGNPHRYCLYMNGEYRLCILEGMLCLCDILVCHIAVIWRMNNYEDANSWVKAFTIQLDVCEILLPLKVSANGDLLFTTNTDNKLFTYSKNTGHIVRCEGSDFAKSYNPKPGFAFVHRTKGYAVCDEACKRLRWFNFPPKIEVTTLGCYRAVVGSTNGLLLVWDGSSRCNEILFVCNPITSEYVELPSMPMQGSVFGFGVSRLSGQYKILCGNYYTTCHVYTLGGSWRSVGAAIGHPRLPQDNAAFVC
ncbi:putative F-box protein At3g16210 [Salvia splendens]|uniref:putative F-box protein At3g16210 n=1 Tax=Salvia splendens TaxID=180675 RepID=UPI001C260256|nr:putative F-box protein At3g16210 [Salvia splendens]